MGTAAAAARTLRTENFCSWRAKSFFAARRLLAGERRRGEGTYTRTCVFLFVIPAVSFRIWRDVVVCLRGGREGGGRVSQAPRSRAPTLFSLPPIFHPVHTNLTDQPATVNHRWNKPARSCINWYTVIDNGLLFIRQSDDFDRVVRTHGCLRVYELSRIVQKDESQIEPSLRVTLSLSLSLCLLHLFSLFSLVFSFLSLSLSLSIRQRWIEWPSIRCPVFSGRRQQEQRRER